MDSNTHAAAYAQDAACTAAAAQQLLAQRVPRAMGADSSISRSDSLRGGVAGKRRASEIHLAQQGSVGWRQRFERSSDTLASRLFQRGFRFGRGFELMNP